MGRSPCCDDEAGLKKGPWTPEEDQKLVDYIQNHGHGSWRTLPKHAGLNRCGKSCRLRWINYLRPDIKRGRFSLEEEQIIIRLHSVLGNKWSAIANHLPGRTDNEIKNFWNTHLRKKLLQMGIDPVTHKPRTDLNLLEGLAHLLCRSNCGYMINSCDRLLGDSENVAKLKLLQGLLQVVANYPPNMAALNLMGQPMAGDFQLNWLQQSKSEIDAIVDGCLGHVHDPNISLPSCFSNLGELQALCNYEALKVTSASFEEQAAINGFASEMPGLTHVNDNSYTTTTNSYICSTSIPASTTVLATSGVDQTMPPQINQTHDLPTHSTTSTSFETWEELINLDDQTNAYQWTDFIDSQTRLQ